MFANEIYAFTYQALILILLLSGPPIIISTVLGLIVAIFQAATQIQEQTLSFTVKLFAVIFTIIFLGGWLGATLLQFTNIIFSTISKSGAG
ncbi:MAG: type III secretion inner membrane protein SctS [uncultured bacterium]|nr:MAG: type III secretion inner membrane protein SctS [uncultured bacterium]OGN56613.1 MAG: EscS/YscS/HrcS family type III secretion system export apparatus protein [Chlamydiae bacterium RIFCSPHIGHO2_01_FULL_44_39]OGN59110.1 MAG: EscS/YscS/HrcS family type III secretion system export apparatus protein [Chlamydiae bacterium RIFCSPHIGHO2_02_FULL_45_9]OGN61121.1 MAG: EscS/YscS/HrcS family type III secretion system export apparatus protein [Chlamydiae bacterium RIFCSPHIGHO2_12_FULL_44_59]OGN65591.